MKRLERIKLIYGGVCVLTAVVVLLSFFWMRGYMWASWYGPHFQGKVTANGEIFNMYEMTAASRSLPFGTIIEVTECETDRRVRVRINDRGPYKMNSRGEPLFPLRPHPYRDLDLSYAAARELGMLSKGIARVRIKVVSRQSGIEKEKRI